MQVYRIKDWGRHFENAGSRKIKVLTWVAPPTRFHGGGYGRLMLHDDNLTLFGAWVLIVELASRMPVRGVLQKDGRALEAADIAIQTRTDVKAIRRALDVLCTNEIGWMELTEWDTNPTCQVAVPLPPNEVSAQPGAPPVKQNIFPDTVPDRTRPDPVEPDKTEPDPTATGSDSSNGDLPDRTGAENKGSPASLTRFRNWFVLEVAKALGLDPKRAGGNRRPFLCIARHIQDQANRDDLARGLIELATEKGKAGLDNPAAAWQKVAQKTVGIPKGGK